MIHTVKKAYKKVSLAKKIFLLNIGMICFVMVAFTIILQYFFEQSVLEIVSNSYAQKFETVSDNCARILLDAERITTVLFTDEDVEAWFLDAPGQDTGERLKQKIKVESRLDYLEAMYSEDQFSSVSIFTVDGEMVNTNAIRSKAAVYQRLFDDIRDMPDTPQWIDLYEKKEEGYPGDGIAYVRPYREYMSGQVKGYIVVEYSSELLGKNFSTLKYEDAGQYIISDSEGRVKIRSDEGKETDIGEEEYLAWAKEENKHGKTFSVDGQRCLITAAKIDTLNWYMIGVTPVDILTEPGKLMTLTMYALGICAIILAGILSFYTAHTVTKPLTELASTMQQFGKGDLEVSVPVRSSDETGVLADTFNKMTGEIQHLVDQVYREQRDKRKFESAALQAQINPHFLYNTLSSVNALIKMNRSDDAFRMIRSIGQFYRTALSNGKNLIPLRTEAENIENYIQIQKMRYADKIDYEIDFEEDISDVLIVKLTLQPIVENAIYHGVKTLPGQGRISIRGYREGEDVVICVRDNGVGMDEETVRKILDPRSEHDKDSFGLYNIRQRLQLYFGTEYGLSISGRPGKGTAVFVKIPGKTKEDLHEKGIDRR